ncbi:MAG: hypothetical protein AVDCRST_MAG49-749 [uncultured Thermomicrobiales bacterium]|uniref:Uncharacterized protein n=1 Tax=uncultured Thermomicrobiales bacterium TaxID=1645740 RepID=A0A6J4U3T8_9BACT|nr:MAG: hypothetical protein AVDCRST_MAG49-749 [uncultured Thermomicrobiales bacterium]
MPGSPVARTAAPPRGTTAPRAGEAAPVAEDGVAVRLVQVPVDPKAAARFGPDSGRTAGPPRDHAHAAPDPTVSAIAPG